MSGGYSFRDEGVHWGIQNGVYLSRSTIVYFKHNDMESLQSTLEKVTLDNKRAKKLRRYIVVEAIYQVSFGNCVNLLLFITLLNLLSKVY